jgi:pyruvate dehydrogenase E2 component (dihydrolipoamide acetyltransferase)
MAVEIRMPGLSQTTSEVKLIEWLVKVGDVVKKGDPLCRVETDKVSMDVESFESGTVLKLYVASDSFVEAGDLIALIGEKGEHIEDKEQKKIGPQKAEKDVSVEKGGAGNEKQVSEKAGKPAMYRVRSRFDDTMRATPLVKNIALKKGIDLSRVKGTGPGGIISKKDLEGYTEAASVSERGPSEGRPQRGEIVLSSHQRGLGKVLSHSIHEAPHYYVKTHCFLERFLEWRGKNRRSDGEKYSFDSLFIFSVARVLRQFPRLNGTLRGDRILVNEHAHIAFAVSVGEELYAPVVRDADQKNISDIDGDVQRLTAKARNNKLTANDLSDATFTVSNLGMFEIDEFCAIISPPQNGILSVGRVRKMLHVDEQERISIRTECTLCGSFNHRVVNGATSSKFMAMVKKFIEEKIYK